MHHYYISKGAADYYSVVPRLLTYENWKKVMYDRTEEAEVLRA